MTVEDNAYDVLIIEDDNLIISYITEFFKLKGFTCKGVLSGNKGLEELEKNTPKLILLDIKLPGINGYEFCSKIRLDERFKEVPIYYVSGLPVMETITRVKETGANGLICKPFKHSDLNRLLNYL